MNLENTTTPDTGSGQVSSPAPDSGNAGVQTPASVSGQGANQTGESVQSQGNTGLPPQYLQELDKRTQHFNQKITEMGQTNAQYKQQLEQITQREKQLGQTLAQYYGIQPQGQTQEIDPVNLLLENPDKFWELAAEKSGLKSKIESIEQREQAQVISNFLAEQQGTKRQIESGEHPKYSHLTPEMRKQVTNIAPYMPPRVAEIQQTLSNPYLPEQQKQQLLGELDRTVAAAVSQMGGYEQIAKLNFAEMFLENPQQSMQQLAQAYNQKQFQANRAGQFGGNFSGGAGVAGQQNSGGVRYTSETVYKS